MHTHKVKVILSEVWQKSTKVFFRIIQTNLLSKISLKGRRINENMSEKLFEKIIFSRSYIIKQ